MPNTIKSSSMMPCEMAKGGSVWVGASSFKAGVFWCDQDEKVQVKGNEGVDNVYLAPDTGEPTQIEGVARRRQNKRARLCQPHRPG